MAKIKIESIPHTPELKLKHFLFSKGNIFFIHGYTSNWFVHKELLHKLYLLGYNVYAFDLPNHGVNSLTDEKYMFDDYCNYSLGKINERKKRKVILMGHSMGGGIAQVIATQIKHIKCLILEDPLQEGAVVNIVKRAIGGLTNGNNIIATWLFRNTPYQRKLLMNLSSKESIEKIRSFSKEINFPTLVFFGDKDNVIEPNASHEYFVNHFKHEILTFNFIKDAQHSPDIQKPEETFNCIQDFLLNYKKNKLISSELTS